MKLVENCWNCGQTNHHRPACPYNPPANLTLQIRKACKRAHKMINNQEKRYRTCPNDISYPIDLLKKRMGSGERKYFNKLKEMESFGRPTFLDSKWMVQLFITSNNVNCELSAYRKLDYTLLPIAKKRLEGSFNSSNEKEDFKTVMFNFENLRTKAWRYSCEINMQFLDAASTTKIFWNGVNEINQRVAELVGRPNIKLRDIALVKEKLEAIEFELSHVLEICTTRDADDVKGAVYDINQKIHGIELELLNKKSEIERFNTSKQNVNGKNAVKRTLHCTRSPPAAPSRQPRSLLTKLTPEQLLHKERSGKGQLFRSKSPESKMDPQAFNALVQRALARKNQGCN